MEVFVEFVEQLSGISGGHLWKSLGKVERRNWLKALGKHSKSLVFILESTIFNESQ